MNSKRAAGQVLTIPVALLDSTSNWSPLEQASIPVELSYGVHVGHENIALGDCARELNLQVSSRLADADAVLLAKSLEQLDALTILVIPSPAFSQPNHKTDMPIKHVIVLIGENRTFDHLFATYIPKGEHSV